MEVAVERDTGDVRVRRVVAAVDSGEAINPDGIKNQIEGGIIQSISWTTFESVMLNDTRIASRDWSSYPILRFSHVPQSVDVHVIDRPGEHFLGTGEASQGPTAGALANAITHAAGVRIRDLPFNRNRLKQMLAA
jgi:CO/xanthine dehydrogenase Mo-binding subunit